MPLVRVCWVVLVCATSLASCGLPNEAGVYAVDIETAERALNQSNLAKEAFGFGRSQSFKASDSEIVWRSISRDKIDCTIALSPVEPASVHIAVNCGAGPDQATAVDTVTVNLKRQDVIEMIDATLTGRPFNREIKGETAFRWPNNEGSLEPTAKESPAARSSGYGPPPIPEDWDQR